jgi:Ca2+/H+ antiporter, TMEM165/GDT1 family
VSLDFAFHWGLFASVFAVVFVAELPDKTAFASLLLSTRGRPTAVFLGVAGAFVVQSVVAVTAGSLLTVVPHLVIRYVSASLFLLFAWLMWHRKEIEEEEKRIELESVSGTYKTVAASFAVIFVAEWGDLTQLATATLEAKYHNPTTLLAASILALWVVSGIFIVIGHYAKRRVDPTWFQRIAVAAFVLVGCLILSGVLG